MAVCIEWSFGAACRLAPRARHSGGSGRTPASALEIGREYFGRYCAVCHGSDGRGQGDYANVLKIPPPDLTTVAKRLGDGRQFPASELAAIVDGRKHVRAHGEPEMPVWGVRFEEKAAVERAGETGIRAEVRFLVEFIRSLQEETTEPAAATHWISDAGRHVYYRHCATCHGYWGDGQGYLAPLLVSTPADLTQIAARRKGVFPAREIAQIIDGRQGLPGHGSREMPIWGQRLGHTLTSAPDSETAVRGEILLLVEYLRALQRPSKSAIE